MSGRTFTNEKEWKSSVLKAQSGDEQARNELVEKNIGLIYMVLKRFAGRGYDMEELFQIGAVGLIKAVDRFDVELGYSFSTYAVPIIIGEIKRFLRDDGLVHVSRKIKDDMRQIARISEKIRKQKQREPTIRELEEFSGLSKEEIFLAVESGYEVESLSQSIGTATDHKEGQELLLQDKIADEKNSQSRLLDRLTLEQVIEKLEKEEQDLIEYRYILEKTQMETAKLMHLNQVAVSRKEKNVLQKLRLYLRER